MSEQDYPREHGSANSEIRGDGSVAYFGDPVEGEEPENEFAHETGTPVVAAEGDAPTSETPVADAIAAEEPAP